MSSSGGRTRKTGSRGRAASKRRPVTVSTKPTRAPGFTPICSTKASTLAIPGPCSRDSRYWIRNPSDDLAIAQGCYFDEASGEFAVDFIETFCRQSKGKWAGEPLRLLDWQKDFIMRLFGWKRADGRRRFRRAYLEVAKKNGKSTLYAAIALLLLLGDSEGAPEVYLLAVDREQAGLILDESKRMVSSSPELSCRLDTLKDRIIDPKGHGKIQSCSADVPSKDGVNAHGMLFDELHRQKTRNLWDIFEYAGASREQPLTLSITTAGEDESGVWHEQRDYSDKVNSGVIPDTTHLGVVYRALETDDLDDPETWKKANPSLGITIKPEDFAREWEEAKLIPTKRANFLRLRLNIITRADCKFVDLSQWDQCKECPKFESGCDLHVGIDLSENQDLTAVIYVAGDEEDGVDVGCKFYLPEDNIVELEHKHQVPYRTWARMGLITLTPGNVVDYAFVRRDVNALAGDHNISKVLIDPYNAVKLAIELKEQDGLPVETIRQGFLSLSGPTKALQRLILSGRIRHGGHPILRWHISNAIAEEDAAGNLKLSKRKSKKKIDGAAALVNAIAGIASGMPDDGPSIYDTRGLTYL